MLTDNYLGEEGAMSLADALRANGSIRELHLKGNEMGDKGMAAVCEALLVRGRDGGMAGCRGPLAPVLLLYGNTVP